MKGKCATAQELTVHLLALLHPLDRQGVAGHGARLLADRPEALAQLNLCVMMAGELARDPQKYSDFILLSKTILARQSDKGLEQITKLDIGGRLGIKKNSINNTIDSIQDHIRELKPDEILLLCQGFGDPANRRFWENQIYLCFPDKLRAPDVTEGPELDCLQAVWDSLSRQEQCAAVTLLPACSEWFRQLDTQPEPESEPEGLYEVIEQARKRAGVKRTILYSELELEPDTYYAYKKIWKAFEKAKGTEPYPRRRLSRYHLLYLAVFLNIDFYTAAGMLATAGYGFHASAGDNAVAEYLLGRRHSREKVLEKLRTRLK